MIKTVHQYNSKAVKEEDMKRLKEIARDYRTVKQYVYDRYGGINSIDKLYPGYTIQNEMTVCGLRQRLKLPSVYYYLAIYDALGDIKGEWSRTVKRILVNISSNENFTPQERHYLRYILKMSQCYYAVLQNTQLSQEAQENSPCLLPEEFLKAEPELNLTKLNNYLRRQTRRHLKRPHTDNEDTFHISDRAYRYADGGIYISTKENRKRLFVPLTDKNTYSKQLRVKLNEEKGTIIIDVPIEVKTKTHEDYQNTIGLSMGYQTMFTSSSGNKYGVKLGEYSREQADWIREQNRKRSRIYGEVSTLKSKNQEELSVNRAEAIESIKENNIRNNNLGMKKYNNRKRRYDERLRSYINHEINRLIREEEPAVIFLPRLPKQNTPTWNPQLNNSMSLWQRGYIKERLRQKCRENGIEIVEVFGKDISKLCSVCGSKPVNKSAGTSVCENCGTEMDEKVNAAKNARNRGLSEDGRQRGS